MEDTNTPSASPDPVRILFVCLGNICRSPLAEGVFQQRHALGPPRRARVEAAVGPTDQPPHQHRRMRQTAEGQGVSLDGQTARQFAAADFDRYDHIFVMDKSNLNDVLHLDADDRFGHKVRLFREFDPEPGDFQVPDPYYGGEQGFQNVYAIVDRTARKLLERIVEEHDLQPA